MNFSTHVVGNQESWRSPFCIYAKMRKGKIFTMSLIKKRLVINKDTRTTFLDVDILPLILALNM